MLLSRWTVAFSTIIIQILLSHFRIGEYVHSIIGEAIEKFTLLSPVKLKEMNPARLTKLSQWTNISIDDINSEISELMSN